MYVADHHPATYLNHVIQMKLIPSYNKFCICVAIDTQKQYTIATKKSLGNLFLNVSYNMIAISPDM